MIQVDGLSIAFHGEPLFEDATFSLQERERCGFVGRNGSGKSTLFKLLTGKEVSDAGTLTIRKNYTIGTLDQHIHFTMPTVLEEAALGLREEEKDCLYKAETILFGLGFKDEDMDASPHGFSGGYQLRLHLAKLLIAEPNCLLLDEPTNYLDIVSIRWMTRFLKQWKGELILISHDREFMDSVTTHTMGIHRHKIRKVKGDTIAFYEQIVQEEEVHEKTRQNLEKKRAHLQSFVDRFGAKASKAGQAKSKEKMMHRIPTLEKLKALYHLDFEFNESPFHAKKVLEATNIDFSYSKVAEKPLIHDLSLLIEKGERIAIIGKNGYGKSTILRLLAGELDPLQGTVKCSENVNIGYFGQTNINRLHPKHTVEEEISIANPLLNRTQVKGICGLMMFSGDKASKTTNVLSGGEKSRVLLGKILATPCNLLLLDEPTHHLDIESVEALIDALEDFQGAVILVTHSELFLRRLALDKIIICHKDTQELFLGTYDEFLEKKGWVSDGEDAKPKKIIATSQDSKQQRAELINARSKAVKPLDQQISKFEERITQLEKEQEALQAQLLEATNSRNSQEIQNISKALSEKGRAIEKAYEQLDEVLQKREAIFNEHSTLIDR